MQYIFIVALEFVLAFTGVALLIRYYNPQGVGLNFTLFP